MYDYYQVVTLGVISLTQQFAPGWGFFVQGDGSCKEGALGTMEFTSFRWPVCPTGFLPDSTGSFCERQEISDVCPCGDPFNPAFGNQVLTETDISARNDFALEFTRNYDSAGFFTPIGVSSNATILGANWQHNYQRSIVLQTAASSQQTTYAYALRSDSDYRRFEQVGTNWVGRSDQPEQLYSFTDANGNITGWKYISASDEVEQYDANGNLLSITNRSGRVISLTYSTASTPVSVAPVAGLLIEISDDAGRSINLIYNSNSMIIQVIDPAGQVYAYSYDSYERLSTVTYPDLTQRTYLYNESNYAGVSGFTAINLLTGILDENGNRYATFTYDGNNRAASSWHGVQGQGIEAFSASYGDLGSGNDYPSNTTVTEPSGLQRGKNFVRLSNGVLKDSSQSLTCTNCQAIASFTSYDNAGYVAYQSDYNGTYTKYTFDDTRGLETQRIEGGYGANERIVNTIWNPNFRVPDQRSIVDHSGNTESLTNWVYNSRGQALFRCLVDTSVSGASSYACGSSSEAPTGVRQFAYTYCEQAAVSSGACPLIGLVLTITGPRTDLSSVTTYTYYQATNTSGCGTPGGACNYQGDLYQITNALDQTSTFVSYDQNGRVTRMRDANGTLTDMSYSPRGWLLTKTVRANANGDASSLDSTTTLSYDNVGNVVQVTQPDGAFLRYSYDTAHRVTSIADNLGDSIIFTLDAAGNHINEQTNNPTGELTHSLSRQYDQLNRLINTLNSAGVSVQMFENPADTAPTGIIYNDGYDGNGNPVYSVDGNGVGTERQYDTLNRLVRVLQDHAGTTSTQNTSTQYTYDARDNLRSVTDPDGLVTSYAYDGLSNLTALKSPDTGSTGYIYDAAGNRTSQTDARNITTAYTYDALNRLTGITYPTSSLNVTFTYDQPATGCYNVGKLTTIIDQSGSTEYCYDRRGNVLSKQQTTDGVPFTAAYTYTLADRVQTVTYPSGAIATYTRNAQGQITAIVVQANSKASLQPLVSSATYLPFGPLSQITFGNGRTLSKNYDTNYAISSIVSSDPNGLVVVTTLDAMGNLNSASSTVGSSSPTQSYQYDALYRLTNSQTGTTPPSPLENYTYGLTGDRISASLNGAAATSYVYTNGTHQLQSVGNATRIYDASGNTTGISALAMIASATVNFLYNGRGERVSKWTGNSTPTSTATTFVYDESGNLLGEYANGTSQEYVYLDGLVVGIATATNGGTNQIYYVETDQLGTPRVAIQPGATTAADAVVWKWDYFGSVFGTQQPNPQYLTINLRFPGQYFDAETGLTFNFFRDYDSTAGRYIESDPIGLSSGTNTYAYVESNPLIFRDMRGLARWHVVDSLEVGAAIGFGGKVLFITLKSDCSSKGERYKIHVVASGPSAGLGIECEACFTSPHKLAIGGDFEDHNGPDPNPSAFNGPFLDIEASGHIGGIGPQWSQGVLLGQATSPSGFSFSLGFGSVGLEASGSIGTSTVWTTEVEKCCAN